MDLALRAARRGVRTASPNPAVGAVVVDGDQLLGIGYHHAAGGAHAEVEALRSCKARTEGCTLYVTLEPCSTHGRTPPCTEAILEHGIRRVVLGCVDPNPLHAGRAIELLRDAGVEVLVGVRETEARHLIRAFAKAITTGLPWVIVKAARTLDGRITLPPDEGRWLSGPRARKFVHRLRARVDAVMVGAGTARNDDPHLDARGVRAPRQPRPVILSQSGRLPSTLWLMRPARRERTLVLPGSDLREALQSLGKLGIQSVLVEGGGATIGALLDAKLVDEWVVIQAPHITAGPTVMSAGKGFGNLDDAVRLGGLRATRLDDDLVLQGVVQRQPTKT